MKKYYYCLLMAVVLLVSCRSVEVFSPGRFSEAPLLGIIFDTESSPVVGAELTLDNDRIVKTDINGRVLIGSVSYGEHSVVIKKEDFEEAKIILEFINRDQVLFLTLISLKNILDKLENSLDQKNLAETELYRQRAAKINSDNIRFKYLSIVYLTDNGEYTDALNTTKELQLVYPADPYLVLTEAEILYGSLGRKPESIEILRNFLKKNRNPVIENLLDKYLAELEYK